MLVVLVDADSVLRVPGVVVVDASGVVVDGVSVGNDTLCRVGGRVDVTKRTGVSSTGSGAILMQDVNKKASRIVEIFLVMDFIDVIASVFCEAIPTY